MATLHAMLQPYKPTSDDPFDAVKAAHLLSRAGFGGTAEEIDKVIKLGPAAAVDWLMDFPDAGADEQSQTDRPDFSNAQGVPSDVAEIRKMLAGKTQEEKKAIRMKLLMANRETMRAVAGWWMKRLAYGPHPLQEKLTFFWHGHFTTSAKDERNALLMWNQNELLRRNAAGNFRTFVRQISRDPAMLDYLNNNQNRKQHPNENYARELMELFTLGIGNYSEEDIKQAARAFTGWAHDGDDFIFRHGEHDEGVKTFFGRSGNFNGDDIIEIILQHPACSKYIASKMWKYFVSDEVDDAIATSLGGVLRDEKYELRPMLRTMLSSKAFYTPAAMGSQIKSPVQLVVGTIRILGLEMPGARMLQGAMEQMGQVPFAPPNVKGWPGGRMWINTSTLFVRYNTAVWLAGGETPVASGKKLLDAAMAVRRRNNFNPAFAAGSPAEQVVDAWIAKLIQRPLPAEKRQILISALDRPDREDSIRRMIQLMVSMPEYQLC